ncbi:MAG: hypothetical protein M3N08_03075 [Pseudomonadota bacterium]|nr:hypothetical protein [Pseudomonadota bacterium]
MAHKKLVLGAVGMAALALSACSSSVGDGSRPPRNTTIVVPPAASSSTSSTTTTTTTDPY